jgi:mutator protein MutT
MKGLRDLLGHQLLLVPSVAAIIRNDTNQILVLQQQSGKWSLPAGAIEPGESPHQALVREVFEETGLTVSHLQLLGVVGGDEYRITYPNQDKVEFTVCVYECIGSGNLAAIDGEATAFEWVEAPLIPDRLELPYPLRFFEPDVDEEMIGVGFSSGVRYYRYEQDVGWLIRLDTVWKPLKDDPWRGLVLLHRSLGQLKAQLEQRGYQPDRIPLPEDWFIKWVLLDSNPFWRGLALNWVEEMVSNHERLNHSLVEILQRIQHAQGTTQAQRHQAKRLWKQIQ